jgi:drug/metabolite transporter (DMT)-like permease
VPDARHAGRGVWVALIAVQVMFAVHYLAAKVILAQVPASAWATLRLVAGAAVFLTIYAASGRRRRAAPVPGRDLLRLAGLSVFGVILNQICFTEGLARTTPSHSALINTTIPVATVAFAVLLGRESVGRRGLLGIALALAGVLVLLRVDRLELRAEWFRGDLLTQLNAASFALFLVLSRDTIRRVGPTAATAGVLSFGSIGVALYGGADAARVEYGSLSPLLGALALYVVVFPTVLAYFLNYWALTRVESSKVALFVYLQPVIASALSVALLGEVLGPRLVVSSALVFLGVFFAVRDGDRRVTRPATAPAVPADRPASPGARAES